uniref:DENN domain containing 3 n=1 Tax=Rousettus aegyptiacus TaxID=9407 RepID=A0A7J8C1D1_ROUAE|nr:DENN domain containing 3 [Rousettus aegyptiacus]
MAAACHVPAGSVPARSGPPTAVPAPVAGGSPSGWDQCPQSHGRLPGPHAPHPALASVGTGGSIMVVTTSGVLCQQLKLDENFQERRTAFLGFQLLPEQGQLWAVCAGYDDVYIWALGDLGRPPQRLRLQDCAEVRCMIRVKKQIWVGGTGLSQGKTKGKIYVIDAERRTVEKELVAHSDTVKTLCSAEDRYVLSGSGREEGKIAIWTVE